MIELVADTNVILRILIREDSEQNRIMRKVLEKIDRGELVLHVPNEVIMDTVWVLESYYQLERSLISETLTRLFESDGMVADHRMQQALIQFGSTKIDLVDLYLAYHSNSSNIGLLSWDNDFKKLDCEWYTPDQVV